MALFAKVSTVQAGATPRLLHVTDCFPSPVAQDSAAMRAACERGHMVHDLTERNDRGEDVVAPEGFAGYLAAWRSFLADTDARITHIELRVGGEELGYVGRLDRVATIGGRMQCVIDIKSGSSWPTHALQTAAYEHAFRAEHLPKHAPMMRRACVYLTRHGDYSVKWHRSVHDLATFMAYLRIARWEIENGLREPPKERR